MCTNGEHGSSSNGRTLERVCVSFYRGGSIVRACKRAFVCALNQTVEESLLFSDNAIVGFSWVAVVAGASFNMCMCVVGGGSIMDTPGDEAPTLPS